MARRKWRSRRSRSPSGSRPVARKDFNVRNRKPGKGREAGDKRVRSRSKEAASGRRVKERRRNPSPLRPSGADAARKAADLEQVFVLTKNHHVYSTYELLLVVVRQLIHLQESNAFPMDIFSFRRKMAEFYEGPYRLPFIDICNVCNLTAILKHLWFDNSGSDKSREDDQKGKKPGKQQKSEAATGGDPEGKNGPAAETDAHPGKVINLAEKSQEEAGIQKNGNTESIENDISGTEKNENSDTADKNPAEGNEKPEKEVSEEVTGTGDAEEAKPETSDMDPSDVTTPKKKDKPKVINERILGLLEHFGQVVQPKDLSFEQMKFESCLIDLLVTDGVLIILRVRSHVLRRIVLRNLKKERRLDLGSRRLAGESVAPPVVEVARQSDLGAEKIETVKDEPEEKEEPPVTAETLHKLLRQNTAREMARISAFQLKEKSGFRDICVFGTRVNCRSHNPMYMVCHLIHFKPIILPNTLPQLGDCSYLDTCRHIETCRFVHYQIESDYPPRLPIDEVSKGQWICCDVRKLDFSIFNPYVSVVMADPPWDIHMDLPYGTMKDSEMKNLKVQNIQNEGLLFLWVTGRTLEVGRECMEIWGYRQVDEIVWVKTNQLQRIIRTGRTGHWLNHSKEHCLIGIKGNPVINRYVDCDVVVSEVRETSRKPDEIYRLIERMVPGSLKLEIFGRSHNIRNNWITLGNQLDGYNLTHPVVKRRYEELIASTEQTHSAEAPNTETGAD